jgi:hypothetical protein
MDYRLNLTDEYHINHLSTLGWELTICNSLYFAESPVRKVLRVNDSYGHLLYDYLGTALPMGLVRGVLEIGGGYGYLMKDFLERDQGLRPCMLDISPFLLKKQRETLMGYEIVYQEEDFLKTAPAFLKKFDLVVLNENLGDFPTMVGLNGTALKGPEEGRGYGDTTASEMVRFFERYSFDRPENDTFNVNIGALQALEKLCLAEVPYIWVGEHSCEARSPVCLRPIARIEPTGDPERISLKGHDEYSIKFSYLEKMAQVLGYTSKRGPFADFITVDYDLLMRHQAVSRNHRDDDEILQQFVEDIHKYEYLILKR